MDSIYQFNDRFNFTIARCGKSLVGNKALHPEVKHAWSMNLDNKFHDWDCERFWVVTKGNGHVISTFGEFDVTEGRAYYLPASTIIKTSCADFMEQYFINFITLSNNLPLGTLYSFDFETNHFETSLNLVDEIIKKNTQKNFSTQIFINSAMTTLLSLFVKDIKSGAPTQLRSALKYIEKHLSEKISVTELARQSGYTLEYFSSLFKSTLNISPQQSISQKRIALAKHLLLSTTLSINEIAVMCGYNDPLYFSRVFTKQTLCSPSTFRLIKDETH